MDFEKVFVGLGLAVLVFTVGLLLYADGASNYDITVDNSSFNGITQESIDLAA